MRIHDTQKMVVGNKALPNLRARIVASQAPSIRSNRGARRV